MFGHYVFGFREGDPITVWSSGNEIASGIFVRVQGRYLVWLDEDLNMNVTDLNTITIARGVADEPE